jgi:hypothetical protein
MPGLTWLDPGIHAFLDDAHLDDAQDVDGLDKPGHDAGKRELLRMFVHGGAK